MAGKAACAWGSNFGAHAMDDVQALKDEVAALQARLFRRSMVVLHQSLKRISARRRSWLQRRQR